MTGTIAKKIKGFAKDKKISLRELELAKARNSGFSASYLVEGVSASLQVMSLLEYLKTAEGGRFTILADLFAADFPKRAERFEIVYSLLSLEINMRIILKIRLAEDVPAESAAKIFSSSVWYEREIFDLFGVQFNNCPDNRRILTDYGFKGHPLRKEFPLTGHLEVSYSEELEEVIYEPVILDQGFRQFDFRSPWKGPEEYVLPGDEKATNEQAINATTATKKKQ